MMQTDIVKAFDPAVLQTILQILRNSFPEEWIYDDAEEYYGRMLRSPKSINILLKDSERKVGYLLAIPHNDAVEELKEDDPEMKEDPSAYYIETVGILPEYRNKKGLPLMLQTLIDECKKRGINKISLHARVSNHLSEIIQKKYRTAGLRRIREWAYYHFEEPTDYMEIILV